MRLPEISVRRPLTVTMTFLAVVLFGLYALDRLPLDLFPEIEPPYVSVVTLYLGASASDVEDKVTNVIEDHVGLVTNIKRITSSSKENMSLVTLEFEFGTDLDEAANEIREQLELVKHKLPDDIETPVIFKMNTNMMPVYIMSVRVAQGDYRRFRDYVEDNIKEPLQRIPGVGSVQLFNAPEPQVLVEVDRRKLAALHLPLLALAQAIGANNASIPSGRMDVGTFDLPVRVPGEFQSLDEIRGMVVGNVNGALVHLRDVASVRWGYKEVQQIARDRGKDAMIVMVQKQSGANTVEVVDRIREKLKLIESTLPPELSTQEMIEGSEFIRTMVNNLSESVLVAFLLVVLVVFVFLRRLRTSLIIALAIPASLIAVFFGMYMAGYTLNVITLMAMALSIGMVVDNVIVVLENIARHVEGGKDPAEAAIEGTSEVGLAVTASTLTTVVVFLPLAFVGGLVGIFFGQLGFVITITIGASLATALTLTPMLGARWLKPGRHGRAGGMFLKRFYETSERSFTAIERWYGATVRWALDHRWRVVLIALFVFGSSLSLLPLVGFDFIPMGDTGDIQVIAELRTGTRVEETSAIAEEVARALEREPEVKHVFHMSGTTESGFSSASGGKEGIHILQVFAKLVRRTERTRTDRQVAEAAREVLARHPEVVSVDFKFGSIFAQMLMGQEKPVTVNLQAKDFDRLARVADRVKSVVAAVPGVKDVSVDLFQNRPELAVDVDRTRASRLGVSVVSVGATLRAAVYGATVSKFRAHGDEYDIVLKLRKADRDEPADLGTIEVPSMAGKVVQIRNIARVTQGSSPIEIQHRDKQRLVRVGANYTGRALGDIAADLEAGLKKVDMEGVSVSYGGEFTRMAESNMSMMLLLILGIVLIYMVMAAQFESLLDPFVVMFAIPFGFTGVALAMVVTGTTLTLSAILGVVLLLGIVVKNAIVLVDYINLMRRQGMPLMEAVVTGGTRRLRPVLMTSLTTAFGMLPLALARAEGAEMWGPMGKAVIGGLLVSLVVTLVLVPTIYVMMERFRKRRHAVDASTAGLIVVCLAGASLLFAPTGARAQEASRPMTLPQCVEFAMDHNPDVRIAGTEEVEAVAVRRSARGNFGPVLGVEGNLLRWNSDSRVAFIDGAGLPDPTQLPPELASLAPLLQGMSQPTLVRKQWTGQISVTATQPLTNLWTVAEAFSLADHGVDVSRLKRVAMKSQVALQVVRAYFGVLQARRFKEIAQKSLDRVEAHVEQARLFFEQGLIPKSDFLKAKVGLAKVREIVIQAHSAVAMATAFLRNLIGLTWGIEIQVVESDVDASFMPGCELDECVAEALSGRPEIRMVDAGLGAARAAKRLAISRMLPSVVAMGSYMYQKGNTFQDEKSWFVGGGLKWDFWNWGRDYYQVEAAQARLEKADIARDKLAEYIALEVKNARLKLEESRQTIAVTQAAVAQAEEALRIEKARFEQHMATSTDVLDAETEYTDATNRLDSSRYEFMVHAAEFRKAIGSPVLETAAK